MDDREKQGIEVDGGFCEVIFECTLDLICFLSLSLSLVCVRACVCVCEMLFLVSWMKLSNKRYFSATTSRLC